MYPIIYCTVRISYERRFYNILKIYRNMSRFTAQYQNHPCSICVHPCQKLTSASKKTRFFHFFSTFFRKFSLKCNFLAYIYSVGRKSSRHLRDCQRNTQQEESCRKPIHFDPIQLRSSIPAPTLPSRHFLRRIRQSQMTRFGISSPP